jgi:uncharacterized coiled-coil protein SlyX
MKGFNPLAALTATVKAGFAAVNERLDAIVKVQAEHTKTLAELTKTLAELTKTLAELTTLVHQLISEVSRYKNDSEELMVSMYAYCDQEGIAFSHGDLKTWGGRATRMSRRLGFKVEQTNDPRFGSVNLYERRVLDLIFDY